MKIAYKIIAVVLALAVIPMIFFIPIASVRVQSTALQAIIFFQQDNPTVKEFMKEHNGKLPDTMGVELSIKDLISGETASMVKGIKEAFKDKEANEDLKALISPVAIFITLLALIMICAVVTVILAIVAKDNRKVIYSSMAGIGFSVMVKYAFEAIADLFTSGKISLASLGDNTLLSLVGKIEVFALSSAYWFIPLVFLCVIIWTVLYNMTLPENEKRERKLQLGEAE